MHRAAIQVFRTARRSNVRRHLNSRVFSTSGSSHAPAPRFSSAIYQRGQPLPILQSSMYFRSFTVALISSLVASGAWFAYKETPSSEVGSQLNPTKLVTSSSILGALPSSSSITSTSHSLPVSATATADEATEKTRRALVVENDQFFAGEIVGDKPLSKETDASGRLVLEMLTPEQATQRLRQSEQSYLVGRGQGVVRYDVVQLPSNNPIEDDHSEKIIAVPDSAKAAQDQSKSDWMFWGVFDGHRYVSSAYSSNHLLMGKVAGQRLQNYVKH